MSKKPPVSSAPPNQNGGFMGWLRRNRYYFLAFFLPIVLLYIAYAIFGMYPFGEQSVLCLDLNGQYVYYFEAIRDAFHGDGSILYNWSRNLSGGYQGVIGYYLASPLTLIVVLLPRTMILGALYIMILCKLGLASVTFCYYLRKSKHLQPIYSVILGTMFGMCAYGVIQTIDPMWLDGLICLPMIVLGIEYLVDDGRKLNFIIPLALICIANFYIGFMCCIFTAIYFIVYVIFLSPKMDMNPRPFLTGILCYVLVIATGVFGFLFYKADNAAENKASLRTYTILCIVGIFVYAAYYLFIQKKEERKEANKIIGAAIRIGLSAGVAIACAAFMILPVYNALALGKFDFTKPDFSFKTQFTPLEFLAQFCVNQYNSVNVEGKPEVYCGVLALLSFPLFFLNQRIPLKKKLGYAFICVVMFLCMYIRPVDMLWHGGQMPNWLPFRYSFTFSFIILSMAAMTLHYITSIKKEMVAGSFAVLFVLLMIIDSKKYLNMKKEIYLDSFQSIWMTVIFIGIYAVLLLFLNKKNLTKKRATVIAMSMLAVVSAELTYNAQCEFADIHHEVAYSTRKSYRQYVESGRELVEKVYESDPTFYRSEKTYTRTVNDNAGFKLRGLAHSSSVMNAKILKFIETMGYSSSSYFSRYDGNTPLADSVLGIKYVLDKGDSNTNLLKKGENSDISAAYTLKMSEVCKSQSEDDIEVNVYENPNALAIGYMASEDIKKVTAFGNDDPFNSQNILLSTISGNTTFDAVTGNFESWHKYYEMLPITEPLRLNQVKEEPYGKQRNFREIKNADGSHAADPTIDIFLEAQSDMPLYCFFQTENQSKVNLWLSDQWNDDPNSMKNTDGTNAKSLGSFFQDDNYHIVCIGQYPKGQKLQLRMTLLTDSAGTKEKYTIINQFEFYHFNSDLFCEDISKMKENQWNLTTFGGRTLEGTIHAEAGQLFMTSIPAEPGWKIWIDGKQYEHKYTEKDADGNDIEKTEDFLTLFKAMIGAEVEPGDHTIKMKYTPPGLNIGLVLLAFGILAMAGILFYDLRFNEALKQLAELKKQGIYDLPYVDDPEPAERVKKVVTAEGVIVTADAPAPQFDSSLLIANEIRELKKLVDEGILTEEEFEQRKKKLLER